MSSVQLLRVSENRQIARDTYFLELAGDTSDLRRPGQFVNVAVPGFYLRRPLSVCSWKPGQLTLMYKVLGGGTDALTRISIGTELSVLSGLGNGFSLPSGVRRPLIVGGGIGVAPMLALSEFLIEEGTAPRVILGFGSANEVALVEEIEALGISVTVATVDGSKGVQGLVTDAMAQLRGDLASSLSDPEEAVTHELITDQQDFSGELSLGGYDGEASTDSASQDNSTPWDFVYACGPTPMLRAVFACAQVPGQYSMEERMGCGFGACMGCTLPTAGGLKRICKEGPVFGSEVLVW
ncbi:dihydroorotate dehydrogenase electron transfer subunit [Actinomycetaceae bacterium MB13-C1-2]|nr:dihydroorotate dehydrogenase electron transfer subunit [Actinomycetaceae bacterium MB13-C1-2]